MKEIILFLGGFILLNLLMLVLFSLARASSPFDFEDK